MSLDGRHAGVETGGARHVIVDQFEWMCLFFRMRAVLANPPATRQPDKRADAIRKDDFVRTQRDLTIGDRRIARGTVGTVVALHARRPLVEVSFMLGEPISVTIAGYELLRASA